MTQLRSELQSVCAERDRLSSERSGDMEQMDRMISSVSSVTEERDRLLETVQRLTGESEQLERDRQLLDETVRLSSVHVFSVPVCSNVNHHDSFPAGPGERAAAVRLCRKRRSAV